MHPIESDSGVLPLSGVRVVDHPVHFANLTTRLAIPPPELGEDTGDLLSRLGYSAEEIARLREDDVVQ